MSNSPQGSRRLRRSTTRAMATRSRGARFPFRVIPQHHDPAVSARRDRNRPVDQARKPLSVASAPELPARRCIGRWGILRPLEASPASGEKRVPRVDLARLLSSLRRRPAVLADWRRCARAVPSGAGSLRLALCSRVGAIGTCEINGSRSSGAASRRSGTVRRVGRSLLAHCATGVHSPPPAYRYASCLCRA